MNHKTIITGLIAFCSLTATAQDRLSFEQALELTLENNYEIRQAKVNSEISKNSSSKSNNGYVPTLSANGGYNWTYYQGNNELKTQNVEFDANNSYSYNATANLNYVLYDGAGRKYNYLQALENFTLSELQIQQIVENSVVELTSLYNETGRLQDNVNLLRETLSISIERLKRARYSYEYGQGSQLNILSARVDVNNDSISLLNSIQEFSSTKRDLNYLMGVDISKEYTLDSIVSIRRDIQQSEVLVSVEENNNLLKSMEHSLKLNEYAIGSSKSKWMPTLSANAAYQYRGNNDPNGAFVIGSNNFGPNAGLNLSWNIFDARTRVQVKNARLQLENQKISNEALQENLKAKALKAHGAYLNQLFVLSVQGDNVATAQKNFDRSTEAYKIGQISNLDFRQAQLNLLNTKLALSQARYNAKNSEAQVLALMGILVKN